MATTVFEARAKGIDHNFFSGMALVIFTAVFLGFAKSYFLAGAFWAPLPNWLIHLHGAAFSAWIALYATQTALVRTRRVHVHRRLGMVGVGLACLMVVLGVLAGTDLLRRAVDSGDMDAKSFFIVPLTSMLMFGTLIFFAYRARTQPQVHKRLMLIATIALVDAAVSRWPFAIIQTKPFWVTEVVAQAFLVPLLVFDIWSMRKLHRATIWAGAFLILVQEVRHPISVTPAWQFFATWALNVARAVHG